MHIHSANSNFNKTIYDTHVNLLRTTTETMSAVLAGTDSFAALPFNTTYQWPDEFSERIARNQQLLIKEESFVDKIADPAAGSYYIENLTNDIIEKKGAWFSYGGERLGQGREAVRQLLKGNPKLAKEISHAIKKKLDLK